MWPFPRFSFTLIGPSHSGLGHEYTRVCLLYCIGDFCERDSLPLKRWMCCHFCCYAERMQDKDKVHMLCLPIYVCECKFSTFINGEKATEYRWKKYALLFFCLYVCLCAYISHAHFIHSIYFKGKRNYVLKLIHCVETYQNRIHHIMSVEHTSWHYEKKQYCACLFFYFSNYQCLVDFDDSINWIVFFFVFSFSIRNIDKNRVSKVTHYSNRTIQKNVVKKQRV